MKDTKPKNICAHSVKCKGDDDEDGYAVRCLVDDVKMAWILSCCVLKSDNEPGIVKSLTEVLKALRVDVGASL